MSAAKDERQAICQLGYARGTHRRVSWWVERPATSASPVNEARRPLPDAPTHQPAPEDR